MKKFTAFRERITPPRNVFECVFQLKLFVFVGMLFVFCMPSQAQTGPWLIDCTNNLEPGIVPNSTGVPEYAATPGVYYLSECATAFAADGRCNTCVCDDGSSDQACTLAPDLVVSSWGAANGSYFFEYWTTGGTPPTNEVDNAGRLLMNTTTANIGDGPFEIIETDVTFCYDEASDTYTHSGVDGSCGGVGQTKRVAVQALRRKPAPPANPSTDYWAMDIFAKYARNRPALDDTHPDLTAPIIDASNYAMSPDLPTGVHTGIDAIIANEIAAGTLLPEDLAFMAYHPDHGHVHVDDWVWMTLRERSPANNDPLSWPILGEATKVSFCIFDGKNCLCQAPYECQDIATGTLVAQLGTPPNVDFWTDPINISTMNTMIKNNINDHPNYRLGRNGLYESGSCSGTNYQGMSPGFADTYTSDLPGNYILLPCDLEADKTYYVVLQIDPLNLFTEKNEDNNVAVIPTQFTAADLAPPTYNTNPISPHDYEIADGSPIIDWHIDNRINGTVVVEAGQELHIENCTIEFVTPESGILVKKGGILHVHHATLRGSECYGTEWAGIRIEGTNDAPHPDAGLFDPETSTVTEHGVVFIEHATIQDAKIGVATLAKGERGGIVVAENSTFLNNEIGIWLRGFKYLDIGHIQNCEFTIDAPFLGTIDILNKQIGIVMGAAYYHHEVSNNTFANTMSPAADVEERGVGIVTVNAHISIGSSTNGNQFTNLCKGIDHYADMSLNSQIHIHNNTFDQVHKGTTLNGGVFAYVMNNTFNISNFGTNQAGYGIFTDGATGFTIANNQFTGLDTGTSNGDFENEGLVIRNSEGYAGEITDNTFSGDLGVANQFEGQNPQLIIDCNEYNYPILIDWLLLPFDPSDIVLNDQGMCDEFNVEASRRNSFKTGGTLGFHIINAAYHDLEYAAQSLAFLPTMNDEVNGAVDAFDCFDTEQPDHCATSGSGCDPNCYESQIGTTTDEWELVQLYTGLLQTRLEIDQVIAAKNDLENENRIASDKVLTATYTAEADSANAMTKLNEIPLTTPENIDFYNLYLQLINGIEPSAGSGKQMGEQEELLRTLASDEGLPQSVLAQSIIAAHYNETFDKTPLTYKSSSFDLISLKNVLTVYPNPAKGFINIDISNFEEVGNETIRLLDFNGKVLNETIVTAKISSVTIEHLPVGLYFLQLVKQNTGEVKAIDTFIITR